jgi:adenine-specific DNA-methyltransferase
MEKMKMHSVDILAKNLEILQKFFPQCINESKDANGNVSRAIDFSVLERECSPVDSTAEGESYSISWPGKREALINANAPIAKTLRPLISQGKNFDKTKNILIEGDNLDALKLLQENYLEKIKMIYIDPPYNTGNDFIYEDDFSSDINDYFIKSKERDEAGSRLVTNTTANGRFHSDWLSMIYPRLKLARNLLRDDGLIFISIDDNEVTNLRKICDEIFGEQNFIDCIIWKKRYGGGAKEKYLVSLHEYVLLYAKNKESIDDIFVPLTKESIDRYYKLQDENYLIRGPYRTHPLEAGKAVDARPNLIFPITAPDGSSIHPKRQWYWSKERVEAAIAGGELEFLKDKDGKWSVHTKQYLKDEDGNMRAAKFTSIIDDVYSQHGTNEILSIFGNAKVFPYPKPTDLLTKLMQIGLKNSDDIFMDFFAGSGASAHALWKNNSELGLGCRFITVQINEDVPEGSDAAKLGFKKITDITKARLLKVGEHFNEVDTGFRVFKIDSSNMTEVYYNPDAFSQDLLSDQTDNVKADRTPDDLLFQVLLDWGVDLSLPIQKEAIHGKNVYFVDQNALAACFDSKGGVDEEFVKELAKKQPLRVVFRDAGFESDSVKINVEQIFKLVSPSTEVKCI